MLINQYIFLAGSQDVPAGHYLPLAAHSNDIRHKKPSYTVKNTFQRATDRKENVHHPF